MSKHKSNIILAAVAFVLLFTSLSFTQNRGNQQSDAEERVRRNAIEAELESVAVIERKVMVPMRDGVRMQADVYVPKTNGTKGEGEKGRGGEIPGHIFSDAL
jgi:hypothetical protein